MTDAEAPRVTPEELTAPHEKALDALTTLLNDPARYQCWWTSRRAAKTNTLARAHLLKALNTDGANTIYTALTRGQAREVVWRTIWLPMLDRYEIEHKPNQTHQQSIFPNGSSVIFGGLDDEKHILTNLGTRLDLFTPDECQSAPSSLLKRLIDVVISPAISDNATGKILMAGTIPEVPAGYFYEAITNGRWLTKNWSRWDNPFLKDQQKALDEFLANTGLPLEHPIVQRDWFGRLVFDAQATAYRYERTRNGYSGNYPADLRYFSVGIDPGTRDRTAIVTWGWSHKSRDVWQVHERVWPRNSGTSWSEIADELKLIKSKFPVSYWFYDAGSSQMTIDTFGLDYGIPVVKAAQKIDLPGQVSRFADLLGQGRAHVLAGSYLEEDLLKSRWNQDARVEGRYVWSSEHHPDVADAARYGLQGFFDAYNPPPLILTPEEAARADHEALMKRLYQPKPVESWRGKVGDRLGLYKGGGDPGS